MIPVQLPVIALAGKLISSQLNSSTHAKRNSSRPVVYTKPKLMAPNSFTMKNPLEAIMAPLSALRNQLSTAAKPISTSGMPKNPINTIVSRITSTVSQITQPPPVEDYDSVIRDFIPGNAQLLTPKYPAASGTYQLADLDGDLQNELITSFRYNDEVKTIVLKKQDDQWNKTAELSHPEYDSINYRGAAGIFGDGRKQLLVGLSAGEAIPSLHGYSLEDGKLNKIFKQSYDRFEVIHSKDNSSKAYIAIWNKKASNAGPVNKVFDNDVSDDRALSIFNQTNNVENKIVNKNVESDFIEDSYDIQLLRWNSRQLEPMINIAPYYNKSVIPYYVNKIKRTPGSPLNWYNLSKCLIKAEAYGDALTAVNAGIALDRKSELKDKFLELRNSIIKK